jgi:hypothetical protein
MVLSAEETKMVLSAEEKKKRIISDFKSYGLVHPDLDALYETYLQTECCAVCKKVFETSYERCIDRDHETGLFRQVICRSCARNFVMRTYHSAKSSPKPDVCFQYISK